MTHSHVATGRVLPSVFGRRRFIQSRRVAGRIGLGAAILLTGVFVTLQFLAGNTLHALAAPRPLRVHLATAEHAVVVGPNAVGINTAVWDPHLQDASVPSMILNTHATILRYPGGTTADVYHWSTDSITPKQGGYAEPANTFDNWMTQVVGPSGAHAIVTVNYGSNADGTGGGDPAEAAAWVNYANNTMYYGVKYWEIGNEVYGNGYYGSPWNWEPDLHADKSPAAYGDNVVAYSQAMESVDPTIKIGVALIAPGIPPDGRGPELWNSTVLAHACSVVDFVSIHWYPQQPGGESDAGLLSSTKQIPTMVRTVRKLLKQNCGAHASHVQIMVTETNSVSFNPGKQTTSGVSSLFLADDYLSWLRNGAANVDWWDLHDGPDAHGSLDPGLLGSSKFGDFGLISSGGIDEPPKNTPFPSYTALTLVGKAIVPHARFMNVAASRSAVRLYGLQESHRLVVVLVNTSPRTAYHLALTTSGIRRLLPGSAYELSARTLQTHRRSISPTGTGIDYTVQPYTVDVVFLPTK